MCDAVILHIRINNIKGSDFFFIFMNLLIRYWHLDIATDKDHISKVHQS